jgi:2-oxoacid:acceptor oxidoreductase gamma subunit (pyruvate/2-ketoisovalerate family)
MAGSCLLLLLTHRCVPVFPMAGSRRLFQALAGVMDGSAGLHGKAIGERSGEMMRKYIQMRWHGRGGQGAVTAAMILAEAAYHEGYKGVTAAPFFGAERRGAPIIATNRFSRSPIKTFSLVDQPDVVVVLDETLLSVVDVCAGIQPDGLVLVNTSKHPDAIELSRPVNVAATNATECAKAAGLLVAGSVISNTAILGGFARATGLISLSSIEAALRDHFHGNAVDKNIQGARLAYEGTAVMHTCQLDCA